MRNIFYGKDDLDEIDVLNFNSRKDSESAHVWSFVV